MKPTQDYILEHFDLYNRTMFGGTLPVLPVRLTNARTYMGMLTFRKRVGWFGRKHLFGFLLAYQSAFRLFRAAVAGYAYPRDDSLLCRLPSATRHVGARHCFCADDERYQP